MFSSNLRTQSTTTRRALRAIPRLIELERRITPSWALPDLNVPHPANNVNSWPANANFDYFAPSVQATFSPAPGTPVIAEWTRIGKEDDTIAITGDAFSTFTGKEFGKDTEFISFGQQANNGNKAHTSPILRLDGPRAAVTLPDGVDEGLIMVWPSNANGVGLPVRVGAAETTWVGPDVASKNETVSIYGQNLARLKTGSTTEYESWIYYEAPGGIEGWIKAQGANPYKVDFVVPGHLELGSTSMKLWVHNGHGDKYGWSNSQLLTIRDPLPTTKASMKVFDVTDYSANPNDNEDDYDALWVAIAAASSYAYYNNEAAKVFFPKGTYYIDHELPGNLAHIVLEGETDSSGNPTSIIKPIPYVVNNVLLYPANIFQADNYAIDVTFRNLSLVDDNHDLQGPGYGSSLVRLRAATDITFDNVGFIANTPQYYGYQIALDFTGSKYVTLMNCDFITHGAVAFYGGATQIRVDNCEFEGVYNVHTMLQFQGGGEVSVTNCKAKDLNYDLQLTDPNGYAQGRFIRCEGGYNENFYIGYNHTFNFAPPTPTQLPGGHTNAGEQINFEVPGPAYYGKPTVVGGNYVRFADLANYTTDYGRTTASIVDGKGLGQRRKVISIDKSNGTVTVEPAWNVIPDATSTISLAPSQQNVVVYDNDLDGKDEWMTIPELIGSKNGSVVIDGKHVASDGLQIGGVAHFIVAKNRISDVRQGIYMVPFQHVTTNGSGIDPRPQFDSDFFNFFADNTITNAHVGISIASSPDPFAVGFAQVGYGTSQLGTVIRGNEFEDMKKYYNTPYQARSAMISIRSDLQYRSHDLTIVEDNKYLQLGRVGADPHYLVGVDMESDFKGTILNTVIRNNDFSGLGYKGAIAIGANFDSENSTPALFDNKWGQAEPYGGQYIPDALVELPQRVVRVSWDATNQNPPFLLTASLAIWNAGAKTASTYFSVISDSDWLIPLDVIVPANEKTGNLAMEFNSASMKLLGDGDYVGTVTITDEAQSAVFTVILTITNSPLPVGPSHGLPNLRHDQVTLIEAEHFDRGGNGKGFYDPNGLDHVDSGGSGKVLNKPPVDDYYNYTINVPADGWYRVELRMDGSPGNIIKLEYGGSDALFEPLSASGYQTVRPIDGGSGSGEFVYLSYGVQTVTLRIKAGNGVAIDWFRFIPVDPNNQSGLPLPYPTVTPAISQFGATTIQAENCDKGGVNIAYNDEWAGNALSTYRNDELVNIAEFGSGGTDHAIRGVTGQKVNFTVDVDHAGEYIVQFFMSNTAAGATIRLQTPGGDTYFSDGIDNQSVPNTGSFSTYTTNVKRLVKFDAPGPHTVQLYFRTSASNGVSAQVDSLTFSPANLSLMGPFPLTMTPGTISNSGNTIKQVGSVFAVNTPGHVNALRFFVSQDEYDEQALHTIRLWRVESTNVPNPLTGQAVMTRDNSFAGVSVPFTPANGGNKWYTVDLLPLSSTPPVFCEPGLYVVSVDVHATTIAASTINYVVPAASPSVLTLVAGSYSDLNTNPFPFRVYSDSSVGLPTAYFWLDVSFTPMY